MLEDQEQDDQDQDGVEPGEAALRCALAGFGGHGCLPSCWEAGRGGGRVPRRGVVFGWVIRLPGNFSVCAGVRWAGLLLHGRIPEMRCPPVTPGVITWTSCVAHNGPHGQAVGCRRRAGAGCVRLRRVAVRAAGTGEGGAWKRAASAALRSQTEALLRTAGTRRMNYGESTVEPLRRALKSVQWYNDALEPFAPDTFQTER